jgi:hypothetical protein
MKKLLLYALAVAALVVAGVLAPTVAGVMAYLKSQETHPMVNSRLDAFIKSSVDVARLQGAAQGVSEEQSRQAALDAVPADTPPKL